MSEKTNTGSNIRNNNHVSFSGFWLKIWRGNPPGPLLLFISTIIALLMTIPILYVVRQSIGASSSSWARLFNQRVPELLWNTLSLTFAVTAATLLIGVSLAWIVHRTDLPGRKHWKWLLATPLLIPPYIGAVTYIIIFGRSGWVRDLWNSNSFFVSNFGNYSLNIYSFLGVFFVLTMFTYPYIFLIVSAGIKKMNRNYEEAAKSLGLSSFQTFLKVNIPLLRPAIGAGAILVALYVLSDFGAIATLRYVTFTAAIYFQRASFDMASASILSILLIIITMVILSIESRTKKKSKYTQSSNSFKKPSILKLGKWKYPALIYTSLVFFVSVILPLLVLIYWTRIGISMGAIDNRFFGFAFNSLKVSSIAALVSMLLAIPVVYIKSRNPSIISSVIEKLSYMGYALPGVIVALGMIFVFNNHIQFIYGTYFMIILAFIIRFLPQSMQAIDSSLSQLSIRVDEAARVLGYPPWMIMFKVILPNITPGVLAGGALVFVSAIKELPATLMLRPPGFDTLAVRIYFEANEAIYYLAAPAALLIVLVSVIPLKYMLSKY